jgi:hypothetical protein
MSFLTDYAGADAKLSYERKDLYFLAWPIHRINQSVGMGSLNREYGDGM